jgi:MFS superfamily sulfate permease-like transporter
VNPIEKDPLQRRLELFNWITLGFLLAVSLIFCSSDFTLGILLGGLISIVSFSWRRRDLKAVFRNLTKRSQGAFMVRYYIRFIVSGVAIYFIITKTTADVIGLVIGLSIVIINVVLTLLLNVMKKTDPEGGIGKEEP